MSITFARDPLKSPWRTENPENSENHSLYAKHYNDGLRSRHLSMKKLFATPLFIYHSYLTHIDGKDCPSYPSCSKYSLLAVNKHGVLLGLMFTIDRLIHEANEIESGSLIMVNNHFKCYDPLHENDFWLYETDSENEYIDQ